MKSIPIDTHDSPSLILEMIYRLKIKDVMTREVLTADRKTSLREIQRILKANGITGLPVAENRRIFGIVSMDDILAAYENGTIGGSAGEHMSTNLIVLEEDMPLSFAITYFDRYKYGRFPVLNSDRLLVGIITIRDINVALLLEINRELQRIESSIPGEPETVRGEVRRQYFISKFDFENAGKASKGIKNILKQHEIDKQTVRRAATAAYELEMNLVVHSNSGKLIFSFEDGLIRIEAVDKGPGIEDVDRALEEGFSTANEWIRSLGFGAGMGLGNVKRVSDSFTIESSREKGTRVRSVIRVTEKGGTHENR